MDAPLDRPLLRAYLFWCARWLLGGSEYHRGAIRVVIDDGEPVPGETQILRPRESDELFDETNGPDRGAGLAALAPQLKSCFLSPDSRAILTFISTRQPVAAKVIAAGVGIERSKCYVLLTELRDRGLIRDQGDGYVIVAPDVWEAVRGSADGTDAARRAG
jgi:hypothetical protein